MEFEHAIEHTKPTRRQWRTWARHEPAFAGLDYDGLRRDLRTGSQPRKDTLLAVLVQLAQHGPHSELATVVTTACLLPGLRRRAVRYGHRVEHREAMQVLVATLYESLRAFDLAAHPRFVAARLLAIPTGRLRRMADTERTWAGHDRTVPDAGHYDPPPTTTTLRLAVDTGVVIAADAWLIHATRVDGLALSAAAHRLGLGYEAAKKRRQRAENRLAAWWAPGACGPSNAQDPNAPEEAA